MGDHDTAFPMVDGKQDSGAVRPARQPPYAHAVSGVDYPREMEENMTDGEQKAHRRGLAAGMITGLTIGLIVALFIALKPEFFAVLSG